MSSDVDEVDVGLVLHILPEDMARGAQSYARALVDGLDDPTGRHKLATLFRSPPKVVMADYRLEVPMGRGRSAGLDPRVIWRLRRLLATVEPDVLVAHGGEAAKYAAFAKPRSLPMIYLMIGASHPKLARKVSLAVYRFVLRRCARVVALSDHLASEAHELHGVASDRIVVIPNGRDADIFRPLASRSDSPVRVGWIGHMDESKRPERFIEVMRAVSRRGDSVEAWMAGTGPLLRHIEQLGVEAGVAVLGDRDDIPELLRSSHILVFTGRPPEGLPGVLIEAGMCAVPVVCTRVPGAEEVVDHGVTGFVIGLDEFDDLVEAVLMLVEDPALRHQMGRDARDRCVRLFSLESTVQRWRTVIADSRQSV